MLLDILQKDYLEEEIKDSISISKIGYCELKNVRQILRKEKVDLKPEVLGKFFRGQSVHNEIPSILWKHRKYLNEKYNLIYVSSETDVKIPIDKWELKGRLDLLFRDNNKNLIVADWKVVNFIPKMPHQHYIDQLLMYAEGVGAKEILLVYFDSETMEEKQFRLSIDKNRIEFLKEKFIKMMSHIENNTEPPKPFQNFDDSWECPYCQYKKECWSEQEINNYFAKKDETKVIDEMLSKQYIDIVRQYKIYQQQKEAIEEQIKSILSGADGISPYFSVKYVPATEKVDYDINQIKQLYDIERFKIVKISKPYYRFNIKE